MHRISLSSTLALAFLGTTACIPGSPADGGGGGGSAGDSDGESGGGTTHSFIGPTATSSTSSGSSGGGVMPVSSSSSGGASTSSAASTSSGGTVSSSSSSSTGGPVADCDGYCSEIQATCVGSDAQYLSVDECLTACSAMPVGTAEHLDGTQNGNSVACRLHHTREATALSGDARTANCTAAGRNGGGICVDRPDAGACDHYCDLMMTYCGEHPQFASREECMVHCDAIPQGVPGQDNRNTVLCRMDHAYAAVSNPAAECAQAGPLSTACENDPGTAQCEHYCRLMRRYCRPEYGNEQYVSDEDEVHCMTSCRAMPVGEPAATTGNSLACRYNTVIDGALNDELGEACVFAGPVSRGTNHCQDTESNPCDHYCDVVGMGCGYGEAALYPTRAACLSTCDAKTRYYNYGASTDANTLECRHYHAAAAIFDIDDVNGTHCAAAAMQSPVCVALPAVVNGCAEADYVEGPTSPSLTANGYEPRCLKVHAGTSVTLPGSAEHPVQAQFNVAGVVNPFQVNGGPPETAGSGADVEQTLTKVGFYGYHSTTAGQPDWLVQDAGKPMVGTIWVVP